MTKQSQVLGRSASLLLLSLILIAAGGWSYVLAEPAVPSLNEIKPIAGLDAIAEKGVRLGVAIGDEESRFAKDVVEATAPVTIFAAWPKALGRRPAIYILVGAEQLASLTPYPYTDLGVLEKCVPDPSGLPGRIECQETLNGYAVEAQAKQIGNLPTRVFQLLLEGEDPAKWDTRRPVTRRTHRSIAKLLAATSADYIGAIPLPIEVPTALNHLGSRAALASAYVGHSRLPKKDFSLCQLLDCTEQEAKVTKALRMLDDNRSAATPAALIARSLQPQNMRTGFDYAYQSLTLGQDWTPARSTIPQLDTLSPPAWSGNIISSPSGNVNLLVTSDAFAATERRFGYAAGLLTGLGASGLLALIEVLLFDFRQARSQSADPETSPLVDRPASPWAILAGIVLILIARRHSSRGPD